MKKNKLTKWLIPLTLCLNIPLAYSGTVYLNPTNTSVALSDGQASIGLFMDFTGEPTLGGGIDLSLIGPITLSEFIPSAYFNAAPDPAFTGFGEERADNDLQIHFGSFAGLSGQNKLGDIIVNLLGMGDAEVRLAINSWYGNFYSAENSEAMNVELGGTKLTVIPLPASLWFLLSGFSGLLAFRHQMKNA
jgi:hypothetical protein